jgi:hypothetical protein
MSNTKIVLLLSMLGVTSAAAQAAPDAAPGRRSPAAQLLLAHTGELELTDNQVVRLAAIARRAEARRRSLRASMDSARARFAPGRATPGDSVARRQMRERMRADLNRQNDQARAEQRDAIAVLTPDQQARAWDLVASRGRDRGMRRGMRERGMRERGMRERGMRRAPGGRGFPDRGSTPRPTEGNEG